MKEIFKSIPVVVSFLILGTLIVLAKTNGCETIQDGMITDTFGNTISAGFDGFGYNYQAHEFNGTYDSVDRVLDGTYWGSTGDFVDDRLRMKWSDSWLANKDCNSDNKLDRGLIGNVVGGTSKGWLTNQVEGEYAINPEEEKHYTYFIKIGWTGPGSPLWGEYSILQEIYNDPAGGFNGPTFKAATPGFGQNDHWTEQ